VARLTHAIRGCGFVALVRLVAVRIGLAITLHCWVSS
jgi:hypothetical protein